MFSRQAFSTSAFSETAFLFPDEGGGPSRPPDVITRRAAPRIMVAMGRLMGRCIILVPTLSVLLGA